MNLTGALLVGNRTFGGDDPYKGTEHEGEPYGGGWDGPQFVLTHHPRPSGGGVTFVFDLRDAVERAKAAVGDMYVGVLGADVARQCVEEGLLDEVFVSVAPLLLGDGVRLFDHPGGTNIRLEPIRVTEVPSATNLHYRVVRCASRGFGRDQPLASVVSLSIATIWSPAVALRPSARGPVIVATADPRSRGGGRPCPHSLVQEHI